MFCVASRRVHSWCALGTGVQTCALPICRLHRRTLAFQPRLPLQMAPRVGLILQAVDRHAVTPGKIRRGPTAPETDQNTICRSKIGRDACRESVWPNVEDSVVVAALQKRHQINMHIMSYNLDAITM